MNNCEVNTAEIHRKAAPPTWSAAIVTLSSTRTLENDAGGKLIRELVESGGHRVISHEVVKDEATQIGATLNRLRDEPGLDVIIMTGGTGICAKDVTIEASRPYFDKELTAFGTVFTHLSMEQVGMACLLSRATAAVMRGKIVFCLPGSPKACRLALEKIILPEAGHLIKHARE